jgi:hypothetical protein
MTLTVLSSIQPRLKVAKIREESRDELKRFGWVTNHMNEAAERHETERSKCQFVPSNV